MTESTTENSLQELAASILEDGVIDAEEVETLRERLYADGVIDRGEADLLFDLNDAVSGRANAPSWQTLFVEAIADHLLQDEQSPGEVDETEGNWLISRIEGDGEYDAVERALLAHLKEKATTIHGPLRFKIDMLGS